MSDNRYTQTSSELIKHIIEIRKKRGMSQKELAYKISQYADKNVTEGTVSSWEREVVPVPAPMMPYICKALACSSYELYPHSDIITERDVQLLDIFKHMSDREKDILYYFVHDWHGDRLALGELGVAHTIMPEWRRWDTVLVVLETLKEAMKEHDSDVDQRIVPDVEYIKKVWKKLDRD